MTLATVTSSAPVSNQPTALVPTSSPSTSTGLSFGDILDTVNPLQHIPVLSSVYRAVTGSQISAGAEIAGDTLYGLALPGGALMGLAASAADVAVKGVTGSSISQHIVAAISPSSASSTTGTPLVASGAGNGLASANTNIPAVPSLPLTHTTQAGNARYQRVQIFDALNSKLIKMAV